MKTYEFAWKTVQDSEWNFRYIRARNFLEAQTRFQLITDALEYKCINHLKIEAN